MTRYAEIILDIINHAEDHLTVEDIYLPDLTDMIRNQLNLDIDSYEIQVKYTCHECSKGDH